MELTNYRLQPLQAPVVCWRVRAFVQRQVQVWPVDEATGLCEFERGGASSPHMNVIVSAAAVAAAGRLLHW